MSRSQGTGSPIWFHCPVQRRERMWPKPYPEGHEITLTGRTRPFKPSRYHAPGLRSTPLLREYRCTCGHVGWSNHADLERMEVQP